MSSPRHEQIADIFAAAADLPAAQRAAFLDSACDGDADLRREVETLLQFDRHAAAVDQPLVDEQLRLALDDLTIAPPSPPDRIRDYEVLGTLGVGGMGTVYHARQANPARDVALKVIRAGYVSEATMRRFAHEAQILGRLQHPGIAQIFEAGAADHGGVVLPFIAMEFVDGLPISTYAAQHHLDLHERLALFLEVCDAVQHAHQKGVIHRDLKPANILVSPTGSAKVLDFGVARVTDPDLRTATLETQAGQLLGTIPYMSPEQIAGDPSAIDTRTDVYSLGVILYELLAGTLPLDLTGRSLVAAAAMVRDAVPRPLGELNRACRGDLETIAGRALEKERVRRYSAAADLAADLRRYLANEPIVARPPSSSYLLMKFAQRNRGLVTGATAALLLLLLGIAGTSYGLWQATRQRDAAVAAREELGKALARAERETQRAQNVSGFLVRMLTAPDPVGGDEGSAHDVTVLELLTREEQRLGESLADQPELEAEIRATLGVTYKNLSRYADAERQFRRMLALQEGQLGADPVQVARARRELGAVLTYLGRYDEGLAQLMQAYASATELADDPYEHAIAAGQVGWALTQQRKFDEAVPYFHESLAALDQVQPIPGRRSAADLLDQRAAFLNNLAYGLRARGQTADAEQMYRQARQLYVELHGPDHVTTAIADNNIAALLYRRGEYDEALPRYRNALRIYRARLGPDSQRVADTLNNLAMLLHDAGQPDPALVHFTEALEIYRTLLGEDHIEYITTLKNRAFVQRDQADYAAAEAAFRRVHAFYAAHEDQPGQQTILSRISIARCLWPQDRHEEAEAALLALHAQVQRDFPPEHLCRRFTRAALADLYDDWGRPQQAAAYRTPGDHP